MKILVVKSSPRKHGNTNSIIDKILEGAEENGHLVLPYDLNEMSYRGCQACRVCKEKGVYCVLNDDLNDYWNKLRTADVLILGSPNYMGTVSGLFKSFIDRHYCTKDINMNSKLQPGKKAVLVFSQGNSNESYYADNYRVIEKYLTTHEMEVQTIIHSGHVPAKENKELMEKAYQLGKSI